MKQTVAVVVARADILERIVLSNEAPETMEVPTGSTLQVKLLFKFAERSTKRDDFRIELQSDFAGRTAPAVGHSHHDRRGLADDQQGFIMQHYDDVPPGDHLLTWTVKADHTIGGALERSALHGQVMITVS